MKYDILQVGAHTGEGMNDEHIQDRLHGKSKAIFIEPIVDYYLILCDKYYKKFPGNDFRFLNAACSNHSGILELYVPDIEPFSKEVEPKYIARELPRWVDQLTSVYPNHIKDHYLDVNNVLKRVQCFTLNYIIDRFAVTSLDYLAVDTEGHDYEVFEGLNLDKLQPKEIRFEHKHMDGTNRSMGPKYEELIDRLKSYGYIVTEINSEDTILKKL